MNDQEIVALQQSFVSADIGQRQKTLDALVQVFRPSDFRHIDRRLHPGRFVGDMMTLLPTELIDIILAQLDPEDLFTLRNVSSIWNNYLKSPQSLQTMHSQFYGSQGQYTLDRDHKHVLYHNFEQKTRNRCAIKSGQISSFRLIRNAIPAHSMDIYSHGTLVHLKDHQIYVQRLDQRDVGWTLLQGHDLETFEMASTTPEYIIAATTFRVIYCWSTSTFSLVTRFSVPSLPYDVGATTDNLIIKCLEDWFIYHLPSKTLHHRKIEIPRGLLSPLDTYYCHVESSGYAYIMDQDGNFVTYKIDDDASGNISLTSFTRLSDLARPSTIQMTDVDFQFVRDDEELDEGASTIVVVWNNKTATFLHGCDSLAAPTKILTLDRGELQYRYTMENQVVNPSSMIWIPELRVAYDLVTDPQRGMPCGLYRVKNDAWTPVTIDKCISDKTRTFANRKFQHHAVFGTTRDFSKEPDDENEENQGKEEDPSWALSISDCNAIFTGDSNYLLCIHPLLGFTRVWTFYDTHDHQDDHNDDNRKQ